VNIRDFGITVFIKQCEKYKFLISPFHGVSSKITLLTNIKTLEIRALQYIGTQKKHFRKFFEKLLERGHLPKRAIFGWENGCPL
jgi:hypothetical protein